MSCCISCVCDIYVAVSEQSQPRLRRWASSRIDGTIGQPVIAETRTGVAQPTRHCVKQVSCAAVQRIATAPHQHVQVHVMQHVALTVCRALAALTTRQQSSQTTGMTASSSQTQMHKSLTAGWMRCRLEWQTRQLRSRKSGTMIGTVTGCGPVCRTLRVRVLQGVGRGRRR